ncbi:hypothetical protein BDF19DRAFT_432637 [Syncephalis fuscata]|nr:hypothetical protein BDF19DRAFT_432637 [Syncephalis fuscata]
MHPSMLVKICGAAALAVSIGSFATAKPIEQMPTANSWDATTARVVDQLSHTFAESSFMRQIRDALNKAVSDERFAYKGKVEEPATPANNDSMKLKTTFENIASHIQSNVNAHEQKFTEQLLDAFHEFMGKVYTVPSETRGREWSPVSRIVARAIEQAPVQNSIEVMPTTVETLPTNPLSETIPRLEMKDDHFTEMGVLIGQLLEGVFTGKAQETVDVLFLRLIKQIAVTVESRNPSIEMATKSVLDETLEAVKKATDVALLVLQQPIASKASEAVVTAAAAAAPQPIEYKELDGNTSTETALLTETKLH